jgi:uncharacterized protein YjiS (DUF1127 family)
MPWFIKGAFDLISKEIRRHRAITELNRLSDVELRDIGIIRGQIPYIVADAIDK